MSAAPHHDDHEPNHEGPIRTPKQLVVAVVASFVGIVSVNVPAVTVCDPNVCDDTALSPCVLL